MQCLVVITKAKQLSDRNQVKYRIQPDSFVSVYFTQIPLYHKNDARSCNLTGSSRGAFCCACSVNFSLIRETAGMHLRRFAARESRKKISSKIRREKQWFGYLRQPFFSFFLLKLRWKRQSLV